MDYKYVNGTCVIDALVPIKNPSLGSGAFYCYPSGAYNASFIERHDYPEDGGEFKRTITISKSILEDGSVGYSISSDKSSSELYDSLNDLIVRILSYSSEDVAYDAEFRNCIVKNIIIIDSFSDKYHNWFLKNAENAYKMHAFEDFHFDYEKVSVIEGFQEDYADGIQKDILKVLRVLEEHKNFFIKYRRGISSDVLSHDVYGELSVEDLSDTADGSEHISYTFSKDDKVITMFLKLVMSKNKAQDGSDWKIRINDGTYASKSLSSVRYQLMAIEDDLAGSELSGIVGFVRGLITNIISNLQANNIIETYGVQQHMLSIVTNILAEEFTKYKSGI